MIRRISATEQDRLEKRVFDQLRAGSLFSYRPVPGDPIYGIVRSKHKHEIKAILLSSVKSRLAVSSDRIRYISFTALISKGRDAFRDPDIEETSLQFDELAFLNVLIP